jgi:pullulanase/glycogen debranching enzyme
MEHEFATDLDYANGCTLQLILDACLYWVDVFKIDGIRLDNTKGFYKPDDLAVGLPALLAGLRDHLAGLPDGAGVEKANFSTTLEHSWDYEAIDVVNRVGATSCWFDSFRQDARAMLSARRVDRGVMRALNASRDFGGGRVPTAYLENHDHATFMQHAGSRAEWWRTQPWMIALFTVPAAPLLHNGQEWGQMAWFPKMGQEERDHPDVPRVAPRPLDWGLKDDAFGRVLFEKYQFLIRLRMDHPVLRAPGFYPADWQSGQLSGEGVGVGEARQLVVYRRFDPADAAAGQYLVALNFSADEHALTLRFPADGAWRDLLSAERLNVAGGTHQVTVPSNWGRVYRFDQ